MGLDWGERRVGVAISDERGMLAVGYAIWPAADVLAQLTRTLREEEISRIVVGYPLTARGAAGFKARQVDAFIHRLERAGYTVIRWDERYTTSAVETELSAHGISQRRQRGKLDMAAAVLILQSFLDAQRQSGGSLHG